MVEFHCNCNVGTLREILGRPCVAGYHQRDDCRLPNDKSFCQRNSRNCGNESFGQLLSPTLCGVGMQSKVAYGGPKEFHF
ncbi:hypothetical protein TNIN_369621 [Trichonephila inaurata madagascariensis]|uniref:Uncharacterized protein n=1 Tax=Trichonephila inaurata madagascariensis TaxID=2747483 RepID=A0A8X6XNR1_9ARAC|nr:hypothetical protein TNIN_369621 [Trichonephila inaurata madagascariensis]